MYQLIASSGLLLSTLFAAETAAPTLRHSEKIWDAAPHNAFTDLIRFDRQYYCTFREGAGHVSPDGAIRVLVSRDGAKWESAARLTLDGRDLRDPKLSITRDGTLLLVAGAALREGGKAATSQRSCVSVSRDGREWSSWQWIAGENEWAWRISWHDGKAYTVAYDVAPDSRANKTYGTRLYVGDGQKFDVLVDALRPGGTTEATLRFAADGTCYCLQRRDGKANSALLGIGAAPYKQWEWQDLGVSFGGPNLLQWPNGRWFACGRLLVKGKPKTVLCELDAGEGALKPLLELPSGGDTSYPGMVEHADGSMLISYYSSHEGKTAIYLATVDMPRKP